MENLEQVVAARAAGRLGTARAIREKAGLSLRELARHIQVDSTSLSSYERGIARPSPEVAIRWYRALQEMARGTASAAQLGQNHKQHDPPA